MVRTILIDGSDQSDVIPVASLRLSTAAHRGEQGSGTFDTDDEAAALSFSTLKLVRLTEDASGGTKHLVRGRLISKTYGRGTFAGDDDRIITCQVQDANWDLRRLRVHQWDRPSETGRARVIALLAYILNGSSSTVTNANYRATTDIASTYVPDTNTVVMPARLYDASDPVTVLDDCARAEGKDYFVYVDDAGDMHLFYDRPDSMALTCTLSITDDAPDLVTEFAPIIDGTGGDEDGSELLSGGALVPSGGILSIVAESRPGISSAHDVAEETIYDSGADADASIRLGNFLDERQYEELRYRCGIDIPAEQAHLVRAGQMISFRAAAAGVTTPITVRITRVEYTLHTLGEIYQLNLELAYPDKLAPRIQNHGQGQVQIGQASPTGCFDSFSRTILPGAWGAGEMGKAWSIALLGSGVGDPELAKEAYYVQNGEGFYDAGQVSGAPLFVTANIAITGEWPVPAWAIFDGRFLDHGYYASEYELPWVVCSTPVYDDDFTFHMRWIFGDYQLIYYMSPHNPGAGTAQYEVWMNATADGTGDSGYTIGGDPGDSTVFVSGWEVQMSDISGKYCVGIDVEIDPSLRVDSETSGWGGEISYTATSVTGRAWKGGSTGTSATISAITPAPPTLLKFQPMRTTAPTGDDTIFKFTVDTVRTSGDCSSPPNELQYDLGAADGASATYSVPTAPYEPGTLQVWLDGLDQTPAITETDPAAGTFTFSFTPLAGERIVVEYRQAVI